MGRPQFAGGLPAEGPFHRRGLPLGSPSPGHRGRPRAPTLAHSRTRFYPPPAPTLPALEATLARFGPGDTLAALAQNGRLWWVQLDPEKVHCIKAADREAHSVLDAYQGVLSLGEGWVGYEGQRYGDGCKPLILWSVASASQSPPTTRIGPDRPRGLGFSEDGRCLDWQGATGQFSWDLSEGALIRHTRSTQTGLLAGSGGQPGPL